MAHDVTHIVKNLNTRNIAFGITFEQLLLILYPLFLIPVGFLWYRDLRNRKFAPKIPQGCIKLGLDGSSNMSDEYDSKYDTGTKDTSKWKVKALFVHPIKSCAAIELSVADFQAHGMEYDRLFAFAEHREPTKADVNGRRDPVWTFRTLRQPGYEKLALVESELWIPKPGAGDNSKALRRVEREGCLIVKWPNIPTGAFAWLDRLMLKWSLVPKQKRFTVPLHPSPDHDYTRERVDIWSSSPEWLNMRRHVPADFAEWIGTTKPLSIFRADPESHRHVFGNAPRKEDVGFQPAISFQDAYPLNIINISSVHDVGQKIDKAEIRHLSARRFRPNILIEGPAAYDEDDWKRCKIGGFEIFCSCHTTRCKLPNVDPDTGIRHPIEPDKTLRSFRCIDEGDPKTACLGMQLVPASTKPFTLRVGDPVEVIERGQHYFEK